MLLPIIDSFIKEVNNLAGDPNSPSFDEELTSCLFVMANETNPVNLGCKFFMLNISSSVLRKILTYLTILKLRSDSLRSSDGLPINQSALTLALNGIVQAIAREEEPIDSWKRVINAATVDRPKPMETSSGDDDKKQQNSLISQNPGPSTSTTAAFSPAGPIPGRVARQSGSNRSSRNSTDSQKTVTGPRPGTSKQSILYKQNRSESCAGDESTPGKQIARGLHTPTRGHRPGGRRGRTSSVSSASSASSPLSVLSPSSEPRPDPLQSPFTSTTIATKPRPPIAPFASVIVGPSTSSFGAKFSSTLSSTSTSTSTAPPQPAPSNQPTYGLIVTFPHTVSIPIRQGLIRALEPYRDKILTTPLCANFLFIKLKDKKDVYFLKRQIEILTRLMPKIVVTKFSRFQIDVPKQLVPTIREFVNLNTSLLKGEYYVYSRMSTSDENITTIEILANIECQQSIESSSCLLKIGQEARRAIPMRRYQECPRCFFCYDSSHPECSQGNLMKIE